MSASLFDSPVNTTTAPAPAPNSFDYHPVPILAPVSLFLGITSLFAFITIGGLPIALIGLVVSAWCLLRILRSDGVMGGRLFAWSGLVLSLVSFVGGGVMQSVLYATEVPEGFARMNFTDDISKKGFVIENGYRMPHPDVMALDGEKIFLKGYMYPSRRTENFSAFVFCRDSGQCCFGGTPKLEDMIVVELPEGQTVDFFSGLVSVAGTFHLREDLGGRRFAPLTKTEPIFKMTATLVEPSQTSF